MILSEELKIKFLYCIIQKNVDVLIKYLQFTYINIYYILYKMHRYYSMYDTCMFKTRDKINIKFILIKAYCVSVCVCTCTDVAIML